MTELINEENLHDVLGQIAYQIKDTMDTMHAALQQVAPQDARDGDRKLDEHAALLNRNFYRLRRLAGNLEEAAELDSPLCPPHSNDDIVGLCASVTERARYAAKLLDLTLEFKADTATKIIALDTVRIERLLLNLLSNAFKFTPRGGKVTVEVRAVSGAVEIHVSDTGCGIRSEYMENLFTRYRTMNYPDGTKRGLGLGLPICRKIAQDHGGTLVVMSTEGGGTTVVATLENKRTGMVTMGAWIATDYSGGFDRTRLELADALPKEAFLSKLTD